MKRQPSSHASTTTLFLSFLPTPPCKIRSTTSFIHPSASASTPSACRLARAEDRLLLPSSARTHVDVVNKGEGEKYSIARGLPIGSSYSKTCSREPPTVITSTVSASPRAPPSSSTSASNPPFSAFGIISRSGTKSNKKDTPSASLPLPGIALDGPRSEPAVIVERNSLPMHDVAMRAGCGWARSRRKETATRREAMWWC
ncbi:hypothetical protein BDZ97DRAFT_1870830 [Flammula alnicola]|nr:hypothetical protein BDZ97DRAFT_1870830 [Flammula alnicola]